MTDELNIQEQYARFVARNLSVEISEAITDAFREQDQRDWLLTRLVNTMHIPFSDIGLHYFWQIEPSDWSDAGIYPCTLIAVVRDIPFFFIAGSDLFVSAYNLPLLGGHPNEGSVGCIPRSHPAEPPNLNDILGAMSRYYTPTPYTLADKAQPSEDLKEKIEFRYQAWVEKWENKNGREFFNGEFHRPR